MTTYPDDVVEKALATWFSDAPEVFADMTPEYRAQMMKDMRRALAAVEAAMWRSIETAPKMQTILLFAIVDTQTGNWKLGTGFWHTGYEGRETTSPWCWDGHQVRSYETQPTHWMPLPTPPAASPGRG